MELKCQSMLGIQECNRLIRLKTSSEGFSENNETLRNRNSRSVCLQAVSPISPIYDMEARSKQVCNRCDAAELEQDVCFCIPTFQSDDSGDKRGSPGKCRNNDTSGTHITHDPHVYTTPIAFTSSTKTISKLPGRKTFSYENQFPKVSGVEC